MSRVVPRDTVRLVKSDHMHIRERRRLEGAGRVLLIYPPSNRNPRERAKVQFNQHVRILPTAYLEVLAYG